MGPAAWASALGATAWAKITAGREGHEVAALLTQLTELGWEAPTRHTVVIDDGRAIIDGKPVITAGGLARYWAAAGNGFVLLRARELAAAVSGTLFPAWTQIAASYEEACAVAGAQLPPLPRYFVGGDGEGSPEVWARIIDYIEHGCPPPQVADRRTAAGPNR